MGAGRKGGAADVCRSFHCSHSSLRRERGRKGVHRRQGRTESFEELQRKIKREVEDFSEWCHTNVVLELSDIRLKTLEDYRKTWPGAPITRRKRQERLRSFFLYCARHEWITKNHAKELSPIKVKDVPTVPLTPGQFQAVLKASEDYNPKAPDREYWRRRAKAMLLLLRWSGLRIGDAARLERNRLTPSGAVMLYMQKTGEPVYVPLPPDVVQMLREFPNSNSAYFFWNGVSAIESPGKRWWSTMKKIFKSAGIPDAHPHVLRDMFAVELLLSGASLEEVSVLLGHSSVKITEKHYKPWVRSRQIQLEERVRKSW